MPVMRVHSTIGTTPHFPFLWQPDAAAAMRVRCCFRWLVGAWGVRVVVSYQRSDVICCGPTLWHTHKHSHPTR
jgi:hypothetical protein